MISLPIGGNVDGQAILHSAAFGVFVLAYWAGGVWSRVKLGYHTYPQVFGGMILGGMLAASWRGAWENREVVRSTVGSLVGWGVGLMSRVFGPVGVAVQGRPHDL